MPRKSIEAPIRDYLAEHLELIEPGLLLVNKEEILPNDRGAKGFVDIFARDAQQRLVIIEIKCSDASARAAINELSKYAALIRKKFLLRHTDYRLVVLSTDWHELGTPFAEFARATDYHLWGGVIHLDRNDIPDKITAAALPNDGSVRRILPRHHIWEFFDEQGATRAIQILTDTIKGYGVEDFVILLVSLIKKPDGISHLLYVAQLEKSFDEYMEIIRKRFSKDEVEEFESWISDMKEYSDRVGEAGDKVMDSSAAERSSGQRIGSAGYQIAHPEKARYWLDPAQQKSLEIHRRGRFKDPYLTDEQIVKELVGEGGESSFFVDISAKLESRPEVAALLDALDSAFYFNPVWRGVARDLTTYAQSSGANAIRVSAFNNDDILRTLAGLAVGLGGYRPRLEVEISFPDRAERFFGDIEWNGRAASVGELEQGYFEGRLDNYLMFHHFGSDRAVNEDVMAALGLVYTAWRMEAAPTRIRVRGASIATSNIAGLQPIADLVRDESGPVRAFAELLMTCDTGFAADMEAVWREAFEAAEEELKALRDPTMMKKNQVWIGDVENCDLCDRPFATCRIMADAAMRSGAWGCICALCFKRCGAQVGIGYGQIYEKVAGEWLEIAGGFDETDME